MLRIFFVIFLFIRRRYFFFIQFNFWIKFPPRIYPSSLTLVLSLILVKRKNEGEVCADTPGWLADDISFEYANELARDMQT